MPPCRSRYRARLRDMQHVLVHPHPALEAVCIAVSLPMAMSQMSTSEALAAAMQPAADAPLASDDEVRKAVRDLLRHGGYKPTGRGKPSSEYLLGVAAEPGLPRINIVVDAGNAASLHSGLPVSVVDLDQVQGALDVRLAPEGSTYVFNASGQTIDLGGLLCLCDEAGPCANAVKDAQRTKTSAATRRVLAIVWGTRDLPGRAQRTADWMRALLESCGAATAPVAVQTA